MRLLRIKLLVLMFLSVALNAREHGDRSEWRNPYEQSPFFQEAVIESYYESPEEHLSPSPMNTFSFPEDLSSFQKSDEASSSMYRFRVGDMIRLAVYGQPLSERQVLVDSRGMISYLFIESLPAAGKTFQELRSEIQERLKEYFRFPVLAMTPIKLAGDKFTIMGEVNSPGTKPILGRTTVLSAICEAQGLTLATYRDDVIEQADLHHSFLARNGEYIPVDFEKLVRFGDMSQNVPLEDGDYVHIESRQSARIFVFGEVLFRTRIDYLYTMSLTEALTEAGGLTEVASSRAVIIRGSLACPIRYCVDVNRILKGCACDFLLEPGDIIYVPPRKFTSFRYIVESAVRSFVSIVASTAGSNTFVDVHPHARDDLVEPVTVIGNSFFFGP